MRKLLVLVAAAAIATVGTALPTKQAEAAPLASGALTFTLGTLPPATFIGSGLSGSSSSNLGASVGAGAGFAGTVTTPITGVTGISGISILIGSNAAGVFTGLSAGTVGGNMLVTGLAKILGLGTTILGVPVAFGAPGTVTVSTFNPGLGGTVGITATATGWTVGNAAVTGVPITTTVYIPAFGSAMKSLTVTVSTSGLNALSPGGAGTLVLVTPIKVETTLAASPVIPTFGVLVLGYVPEPGTLLLLGSGIAGLVVLGRKRSRK